MSLPFAAGASVRAAQPKCSSLRARPVRPRGSPPPNAPRRGWRLHALPQRPLHACAVSHARGRRHRPRCSITSSRRRGRLPSRASSLPKGEGRIEIATRLEREGAISNRWAFIANYLLRNRFGHKALELKAGEYEIKKNASMAEIMETLTQGRGVLSKLTIPEGLTSLQIVERLREEASLSATSRRSRPRARCCPTPTASPRAWSAGSCSNACRQRCSASSPPFGSAASRACRFQTPEEAIIFASIVEKETGRADERGRVAAVFINRLKKGMRLQSDPTVIYGIAGGQGTLGRPITRADLDQKTPHNTYQIGGLPPTPICNPGRSAIEATLNPPATNRPLFRRRRHRRPHVLRHLEGAQRGGHQLAQGRARAGRKRPVPMPRLLRTPSRFRQPPPLPRRACSTSARPPPHPAPPRRCRCQCASRSSEPSIVIPGPCRRHAFSMTPGIHASARSIPAALWIPATSAGMTKKGAA